MTGARLNSRLRHAEDLHLQLCPQFRIDSIATGGDTLGNFQLRPVVFASVWERRLDQVFNRSAGRSLNAFELAEVTSSLDAATAADLAPAGEITGSDGNEEKVPADTSLHDGKGGEFAAQGAIISHVSELFFTFTPSPDEKNEHGAWLVENPPPHNPHSLAEPNAVFASDATIHWMSGIGSGVAAPRRAPPFFLARSAPLAESPACFNPAASIS
jgi:hypothetical protein